MNKADEVARIEREAVDVRLSPINLCERAGINKTTWWRIRKNPESMTLTVLAKLETAIKKRRNELAR